MDDMMHAQRGPKPLLIEIFGEVKTAREWAEDERCEISRKAVLRRYSEGLRGSALLKRHSNAGRPKGRTINRRNSGEAEGRSD